MRTSDRGGRQAETERPPGVAVLRPSRKEAGGWRRFGLRECVFQAGEQLRRNRRGAEFLQLRFQFGKIIHGAAKFS